MKAIMTTYHGPTDSRGPRIVAKDGDNRRVSIPYDYELDTYGAHKKAADALCRKLGWSGRLIGGGFKSGYFWVFADSGARDSSRRRIARRRRA